MTVDHRIEWESEERETAQALAGTIIAIFPVGVPLGLFILLFVNRDRIMQRQTRSGDEALAHIGRSKLIPAEPKCRSIKFLTKPILPPAFLFELYQPKYWYLPVVDILRRLMLTSGLLVIEDTIIQLLVALAVSVAFMVVFREWKPFYELETDGVSYVCGTLSLLIFVFRDEFNFLIHSPIN